MTNPHPRVAAVLQATALAAQKHDRPDLAQDLATLGSTTSSDDLTVLVAGEFKKGKSSLINALLNLHVCPVDHDESTAVPTVVRHADSHWATAHCADGAAIDIDEADCNAVIQRGQFVDAVGELRDVDVVERGVTRGLLKLGITLIDTSGAAGVASPEAEAALQVLGPSSAVLFVTDCSQELTAAELGYIARATARSGRVVVVMAKRDLYPAWRKIVALNQAHLAAHGIEASVVPVSSSLRLQGMITNDQEMNDESGVPDLVQTLARDIAPATKQLRADAILGRCLDAVAQMNATLSVQQQALQIADDGELKAALHQQQGAAEALASQASKWNTVLADAMADLAASVDHLLGGIGRDLGTQVDELIEATDPSDDPTALLGQVRNQLAERVGACLDELHTGADAVAARVAAAVNAEAHDLLQPSQARHADSFLPDTELDVSNRPKLPTLIMTGLRGSYGGIAMFGLFSGMFAGAISSVVFAPATLVVGALFGQRSARDEGGRRLEQRRSEARNQSRKFIDATVFELRAHVRETLRAVQRSIRDQSLAHIALLKGEGQRAIDALQNQARLNASERTTQLRTISASLDELAQIQAAATSVRAEQSR